ncbi:RNA polymerase sigma factor [Cryptosporangium japonicum]|uniref:Sigma-70 family RNA polymerase sigma factor n=1 Tax=Cryptosporangium japonicum TaxID=80872 RepID=A0ABP3EL66_9ACTN
MWSVGAESDGELARAAQRGDTAAFAVVTERHRAALRAIAISLLGYVDEVDDAVQDAVLTAFRRLPELRDPEAIGPWLKAIVRNVCRMQLRARTPLPVAEPELLLPPAGDPRPDEALERAGSRDWVWHAVARLSEPIREVVLLRYFSRFSSYDQIAQLCDIPLDTVGSRLRDGRRALARALRETAGDAYRATDTEAAAHRLRAREHLASIETDGYDHVVRDWFRPDASVVVQGSIVGDRSMMRTMIDFTLQAGVVTRLHDAVGSRGVLVWEGDFVNPPSDPEHCPPTFAWLLRMREGRVAQLGLVYGTSRTG